MVDLENMPKDALTSCGVHTHAQASTAAPALAVQQSSTKGRFKVVGRVVMAMKRFQASLNPTYSYGKRSSDDAEEYTDGHRVLVQPRAAGTVSGRSTSGRTASGRTLSGRPTSAGQQHGFKASLLFRPLPELDTAVKSG